MVTEFIMVVHFRCIISTFVKEIDHDSSKGPQGRQASPFDKFFLQIFNRKDHTHILTKIGEKNPGISVISPFDNQKFGVNAL